MMGTSIFSCSQVGAIEEYRVSLLEGITVLGKTLPEIYTYDLKLLQVSLQNTFPFILSFIPSEVSVHIIPTLQKRKTEAQRNKMIPVS